MTVLSEAARAVHWPRRLEDLFAGGRRTGRREMRESRPRPRSGLSAKVYYLDGHGSLRRRTPKRDKSMSARQSRKLVKRDRVAAKRRLSGHREGGSL